jgi:hypothetical protein
MEEASHWLGGKRIHKGYVLVYCPTHPRAGFSNPPIYVKEHRLIMEQHIGRYLTDQEVVHHIDKNKTNNSIENLLLFKDHSEHMLYEAKVRKT